MPEHDDVHKPDTLPNLPAGHTPVQLDVLSPVLAPYVPALQFVHAPAPVKLYVPNGQIIAVALMLPAGHA